MVEPVPARGAIAILGICLAAAAWPSAQAPASTQQQPAAPQQPRTASQRPPATMTPQSYPTEQVDAGRPIFSSRCGFCHGRDVAGGETGPDLTRSTLVAEDVRGDRLAPVIRSGRTDKGMPGFNLSPADMDAVVAFIHDQKTRAESQEGGRRSVDPLDLQSGSAERGQQYFNGVGRCSRCHSSTGDLAGVANRFEGLALLQRMLYPAGGRGSEPPRSPATATVTTRSGETITGRLAFRDEFTIGVVDQSGWPRSWPVNQVKITIDNPLDAHTAQLAKYTDDDMHDVLAYLQTLR
jgi:cytochrome c oxidase cbb3-type subunit 3